MINWKNINFYIYVYKKHILKKMRPFERLWSSNNTRSEVSRAGEETQDKAFVWATEALLGEVKVGLAPDAVFLHAEQIFSQVID